MPAYLTLNNRGATAPIVSRVIDASPATLGVAITGASQDNNSSETGDFNLVHTPVFRFGTKGFMAIVGGHVYRSTDKCATWSDRLTINTTQLPATLQSWHTGFHKLALVNGAPRHAFLTVANTGHWQAVMSADDGLNWSQAATLATGVNGTRPTDTTTWRNRLLALRSDGGVNNYELVMFEPNGQTIVRAETGNTAGGDNSACIAIFQDRIFVIARRGTSNTASIWEYNGTTSLSLLGHVDSLTTYTGDNAQCRWTAYVKGNFLYVLTRRVAGAWRLLKIAMSGSSLVLPGTDVTATLPAAIATGAETGRAKRFIDADTDPANPVTYVAFASSGASAAPWTLYRVNNDETWTQIDIGGITGDIAVPFVGIGQGGPFFTDGQKNVKITGWVKDTTAGRLVISYIAQSDDGLATLDLFGFFKSTTTPTASQAATLIGTTTGIVCDNTTTRTIIWNAAADGVPVLDRDRFLLKWV